MAGRFLHGECCPQASLTRKKGVIVMTDYEVIMVLLTVLTLVVGLLTALINQSKK